MRFQDRVENLVRSELDMHVDFFHIGGGSPDVPFSSDTPITVDGVTLSLSGWLQQLSMKSPGDLDVEVEHLLKCCAAVQGKIRGLERVVKSISLGRLVQ